jgi:hypothetical protein
MQNERLGFGIKLKPKGIADDSWAVELILSLCVMYLVGVVVQLELLLQFVPHFLYFPLF